jgi:fructose-1,6-bisphosphatase/inositol monophosphatase family enzyme
VQTWDIAAGAVLCAAAGLQVRPLEAAAGAPAGVVVAPAGLLEALTEIVG